MGVSHSMGHIGTSPTWWRDLHRRENLLMSSGSLSLPPDVGFGWRNVNKSGGVTCAGGDLSNRDFHQLVGGWSWLLVVGPSDGCGRVKTNEGRKDVQNYDMRTIFIPSL